MDDSPDNRSKGPEGGGTNMPSNSETHPHLTIDTSIASQTGLTEQRDLPLPLEGDTGDNMAAMHDTNSGSTGHTNIWNLDVPSSRIRAMSESEQSHFSSGSGIRINQKPTVYSYPQLTPPPSYSPTNVPPQPGHPHYVYATSAHLYTPAEIEPSFPVLPTITESNRLQKSVYGSLGSRYHKTKYPDPRSPSTVPNRTQSWSVQSRQPPYVSASSYESVPDSPAKSFLQHFAQNSIPLPSPDDDGQEIGPYILGRKIGHGGFSIVKEAFTVENGESVVRAVKIVRKRTAHNDDLENERLQSHFEHEINVWKCLSDRYVLPLLSVIETPYAFWAFTLLSTGGTLYDALKIHRRGLPPDLALKYSFQLASALRYLHQDARIVHRDVKLENCVLDGPPALGGDLRLCDFGLADFLPGDDVPSPRPEYVTPGSNDNCVTPDDMVAGGSLAFAAPEQIKSTAPLLLTCIDMWSYGVVVHALTVGQLPFSHEYAPRLQMMITKGVWDTDRFTSRVDSEVSEVVLKCLELDCDRRWTAEDVLKSCWIRSYVESDGDAT